MHKAPETLLEAIQYFADPDAAIRFVAELRWPEGPICPVCASKEVSYLTTRRIWKCKGCKKQYSVKLGTIFEDSPLGLDKWLPALWMLANCKNGISSYELAKNLHVTQKTGWFMLSRIRLAMQTGTFKKLSGEVEADETYVGGRRKNMHKSKQARVAKGGGVQHMSAVFGMLERKRGDNHSTVQLAHIPNTRKRELERHIRENIEHGSAIYTD